MDIQTVLMTLMLGGLMGLFGQGIRAAVGLKSMTDDAKAQNVSSQDLFSAARFLVSLLIGFLAGIAATLGMGVDVLAKHAGDMQTLLTLVAAGYMGADFIEGFISKYLPNGTAPTAAKGLDLLSTKLDNLQAQLTQLKGQISRAEIKARLAEIWGVPLAQVQDSDALTTRIGGQPGAVDDFFQVLNNSTQFRPDQLNLPAGCMNGLNTVSDLVEMIAAWYRKAGWTVV